MRRLVLLPLLLLAGCLSQGPGNEVLRLDAQDNNACQTTAAQKGDTAYARCRQNLLGGQRQASADAAALKQTTTGTSDDLLCGAGLGAPRTAVAAGC